MASRRGFLGFAAAMGAGALAWAPGAAAIGEGRPSRTALGAARHRAVHQILEYPRVFDDPLALRIIGADEALAVRAFLELEQSPRARAMRAFLAMRSRYAEDGLAEAVDRGVRQYVVLGAGLDTFGYRNPHDWRGLTVYEVDFPATQEWKRRRLAEASIDVPGSLRFAAVDFERQTIAEGLRAAGFRADRPAFVSMLGVVMYLSRAAAMETLGWAGRLALGSEMVFDFMLPAESLGAAERRSRARSAAGVARIGEPWVTAFDPGGLAAELRGLGYGRTAVLDTDQGNARYFGKRDDGFRLRGSGRMMAAQV
ncbi:MAG: class I SAM-dependent methyltransferase [Betaproteobacteria bacterium]